MGKITDFYDTLDEFFQLPNTLAEFMVSPMLLLISVSCALLFASLLLQASKAEAKPAAAPAAKAKKKELQDYTRAEVAKHTKEGDLWLIIKSKTDDRLKVYDVTSYVEQHPGGDAIFMHAGDDCTEGFNGIQHPPTVYDLVEEYHIGHIVD